MAIINPPRSVRPIEHPIPVNLELRHIRLAFPTIHKHLLGLLLLNIAWASQRSTSNTKIPLNTEAAMSFLHRILAVAVLAAKSTASIIYTSTAWLRLRSKARISLSRPSLLVSSEKEVYRIQTVFDTRGRPLSSNQCLHLQDTLESPNRLTLREQLLSLAPTQ